MCVCVSVCVCDGGGGAPQLSDATWKGALISIISFLLTGKSYRNHHGRQLNGLSGRYAFEPRPAEDGEAAKQDSHHQMGD